MRVVRPRDQVLSVAVCQSAAAVSHGNSSCLRQRSTLSVAAAAFCYTDGKKGPVRYLPFPQPHRHRRLVLEVGMDTLASPAMKHRAARAPLDFQRFIFFQLILELHTQSLTATLCGCFSKHLYSATAAAVVQSRLHEPCSVYYFFASFCVRRKVPRNFLLPRMEQILAAPMRGQQAESNGDLPTIYRG